MSESPRQAGSVLEDWKKRVREVTRCRICANPALRTVLDLGEQALASLFDDGQPHNQLHDPVPLHLVRCDTTGRPEACGFVQLKHTVPPELMFRDYGYRSGINTTMRLHLTALAWEVERQVGLRGGDLLVDIGANDGTTLLAYRSPGIVRVGFEPSDVRPADPEHGIRYLPTFFQASAFEEAFRGEKARAVTSIAMFYDIDAPADFCRQVRRILAEDGLWVIEMGYWGAVLDNNGFDSICHEHLGYYTLSALQRLAHETGFHLYDVSFNSSNGGSMRATLSPQGSPRPVPEENRHRVETALHREAAQGFLDPVRYAEFVRNAERIRRDLRALLDSARREGKSVYGYGASTKGNVLLQYCGIGPGDLKAIADRNPAKWGRRTPGTRIPICSEEEMRSAEPGLLLILPWHFAEEFFDREQGIRAAGTRFIIPFPEVGVL